MISLQQRERVAIKLLTQNNVIFSTYPWYGFFIFSREKKRQKKLGSCSNNECNEMDKRKLN